MVPCALKPPPHEIEPGDTWRESPVCPKKPRKILFEPRASERELDLEGNSGSFWVYLWVLSALSPTADGNRFHCISWCAPRQGWVCLCLAKY